MTDQTTQQSDSPIDILLVEDNPGDIRLTQEAFKTSNHETALHPVTNGDEAVDQLRERAANDPNSLPDMVLLDLNLPGRHGCGVLTIIRGHPKLKCMPVIILTSSSACEDIDRCYDAAANAYLTKPADPSDFQSLVKKIESFWFEQAVLPPTPA